MFKKILSCFALSLLLFFLSNSPGNSAPEATRTAPEAFVPGPDVITGEMYDLYQSGFEPPAEVGLSIGITSCNRGNATAHCVPMPNTKPSHCCANLYRMSGGTGNDERFEQLGHAWVKHTYGAKAANDCGFGCTDPGGN